MNKIIILCLLICSFLYSNAESYPSKTGLVAGKMYFSNQPFGETNAGAKTSFSSNEFIYARLELSGTSIKEAFKLKDKTGLYFLEYEVEVASDDGRIEARYHGDYHNYLLLSAEDLNKTWLNLDVLPEPAKTTTLYSMTDDFTAGYGFYPFYRMIKPENFPSSGGYQVTVRVLSKSLNAWDRQEDREKWPVIEEKFAFAFNENDIATLKKNGKAASDFMYDNAFRYDKMPAVFSNPGKLTDPNATTAKVSAILKRDLPGRAIIKYVAEQYNGAYWSIAKDDYGLPKYKYFNPHIWMAYKMDGKCYVGYITLRQVYSGGGTYGPLQVAWTSTKDDKGIDCGKVK